MRLYESTLSDGSRRLIVHLDERYRIAEGDPRLGDEAFPFRAGDPDPEWCVEQVFGVDPAPPLTGTTDRKGPGPMRERTPEEIAKQQEAEAIAIARESLARKRAEEQQARAADADPFAGGGRKV